MAKPAVYRERRARGLCGECGETETGPTRARCRGCLERANANRKRARPLRPLTVRIRHAAMMAKYYRAHPDAWRASSLRRKYGITLAQYDEMLTAQRGGCAICRSPIGEAKRGRRLFVDHDHMSGEVRGLLCGKCNTAVGYLRDHPEYAHALVGYLMRWGKRE